MHNHTVGGTEVCPVQVTIHVIGGKWKPMIVHLLTDRTLRFNELRRLLPGITQQMLTHQLRELERDGIIHREVYPEVPPKVEYWLTEAGQTLRPLLDLMLSWGLDYLRMREAPSP